MDNELDGPWIENAYTILADGSTLKSGTTEFSLSSYLPNDSNIYTVNFSMWLKPKAANTSSSMFLSSPSYARRLNLISIGNTDAASTTANVIIDASRTFYVLNDRSEGSCGLHVMGYKRLGSKSVSEIDSLNTTQQS